jgi:hypothetical protein
MAAQTTSNSNTTIHFSLFPENFDVREELKLDSGVYKYTGEELDLN